MDYSGNADTAGQSLDDAGRRIESATNGAGLRPKNDELFLRPHFFCVMPDRANDASERLVEGALTKEIIGAFYATYDALGFGFLESVYCNGLDFELKRRGLDSQREVPIEAWMKGIRVGHFRADFVVESRVVLEVKASRVIDQANRRQTLNYLRASQTEVGLLLHFGPKPDFYRFYMSNASKTNLIGHGAR